MDRYCARNLQEREERAEQERRRQHEAQHTQLVAAKQSSEEAQQFTAGGSLGEQVSKALITNSSFTCNGIYTCIFSNVHVDRMLVTYVV